MIILFRVDTGTIIGTGHLMRCLNLAEKLAKHYDNCKIIWATTEHPNNLISRIPESDYIIRLKPEKDHTHTMTDDTFTWLGSVENDVKQMISGLNHIIEYDIQRIDLLIIDHYGIDYRWESKCLGSMELSNIEIKQILVIDDLANRDHICDYLVDTTYQVNKSKHENLNLDKYRKNQLISPETITLLGSKYVMLNPAFCITNSSKNPASSSIYDTYESKFRISISFGGADTPNMTGRVLKSILREYHEISNIAIDIILGGLNQHKDDIINLINNYHNIESNNSPLNINLYQNLSYQDLIPLLKKTHLNIGAGGVSLYERCYLGIPSIIITLAENQEENAINMKEDGIITYLGRVNDRSEEKLISSINRYRNDKEFWTRRREKCQSIVDDQGCNRIIDAFDLFINF